ncbi:GNAT family N-acetyltransferase [Microbacterium album]|uniref:N-acetyltransferase domain-containing protein n=1 Tax=Microbacterium album TaxID=2053191 RepID=A0A917MMM5_9MICO|nr:GNAT family N-acetyltransferase [Microbacterium album]GGH35875.1 hypothetical protein GCM10010921_04630 [Microbacterium album]
MTHLQDGVILRPVAEGDGAALADAYARNRDHLAAWEPARGDSFATAQVQEQLVTRLGAAEAAGRGLGLVLEHDGAIVGRVTLSEVVRGEFCSARLSYWLDRAYTGRGHMTGAIAFALGLARDELRLHRVEAATLTHNRASQGVLERTGFERIGIARRYLRIAGEWQDHVLFQRLLD